MAETFLRLILVALLPVIMSVILYLVDKKTPFGRLNNKIKQVIFGVIFGALAVFGTEWGVPMNGAQVNCRDAAVLIGGLMFGGPAGIIAGVIGGVERWIAVAWGIGTFTRVACSVSTIIAGLYAALLRKFLFENKKPGVFLSLAIGVVMEVFHMTMVFITNMNVPEQAIAVVAACTVPMVTANAISVMLSAIVLPIAAGEPILPRNKHGVRISQTIQRWLLLAVVLAFVITSVFVFALQDRIAASQTDTLLTLAIDEVAADVEDASNANLLNAAHQAAKEMRNKITLEELAEKYNISEINIIDKNGIITRSTEPSFIGYNMHDQEQSRVFLTLLENNNVMECVQKYGPIGYNSAIMRKYAAIRANYGMLQVGYNATAFQQTLSEQVIGITKNRHVGQTGYILVLNENLDVVSAPEELGLESLADQAHLFLGAESDATFEMTLNNVRCFCHYRATEGYYIVSVYPRDEALQMRDVVLYVNTFMEILMFAILFGLIYLLIKKVVVNQIMSINDSLARITDGNLNEVVDVRTNEEFASLSDDINSTVNTLKHYIDEASARIDKELEFAKNIQASALPNVFPAFPKRKEFDIFASMNPAKEVGGDFYDFYMTDDKTLNFLVADVSGKGIPAAMFMMRAKTELKALTEADQPICDVFTHGNEALCEGNDAGMFVTAWQGRLNLKTGLVQFANAGHNPPVICHDGVFSYLKSRAGFVLAGMDGVKYKTQELQLSPGDTILLYTDGVTEATDSNNELYGEDRLLSILNSRPFDNMQDLCKTVRADVDAFVGEAPQFDDITMVALRYLGQPYRPTIVLEEAKMEDIDTVTAFMENELEKIGCTRKTMIQINIVIDEIFSNIVRYGYKNKPGRIQVTLVEKQDPHVIFVRFADQAPPYNPLTKEDPDITLSAEDRKIGGLGIYMVKKTMDDIRYKYEDGQNVLTVKKFI